MDIKYLVKNIETERYNGACTVLKIVPIGFLHENDIGASSEGLGH